MAMHSKNFNIHLDGVVKTTNSTGGVYKNTRGRKALNDISNSIGEEDIDGGVKTNTGVYKNTRERKALNDISNSKSVTPIDEDLDGVKTNTSVSKNTGRGRKKPLALKKRGQDEEKESIKKKTRGGKALNDDTSNNAIGEDVGVSKNMMIKKRGRKALKKKKSSTTSLRVDEEQDSAEEEKMEEILGHNHDECLKSLLWSCEDDLYKRMCQATGLDPNSPPHIPPTDDMNFRSPSPTKSSSSVTCDKGSPFGIPPIPPWMFRDLKYPTTKLSELSDSELE